MSKINSALFVSEITVVDPETKGIVTLAIYKHEQLGGMFAIDTSFIEQNFEDDETPMISDPFNNDSFVELDKGIDEYEKELDEEELQKTMDKCRDQNWD